MDLVGPLPRTLGNLHYTVVTIEYFTKWIEAKPLATITSQAVKNSSSSKSYAASEYHENS
jgi:hypothetical protein